MVFHEVSAARAKGARLAHLAQHDSLTDLPNRYLLNDRLAQAIMMAKRHQTTRAVLFLDLDRFKHINVTASIGSVLFPDDSIDVEGLLERADSAMYQAKDHGRNGYQFYRAVQRAPQPNVNYIFRRATHVAASALIGFIQRAGHTGTG